MRSEMLKEFVGLIEAGAHSRPSALEFELAYQARVAIDRIRFAIKATENRSQPEQLREAGMQLLDALDRLETAERRFQDRWRCSHRSSNGKTEIAVGRHNGIANGAS
ncbi:MAG: hypothetical protein M3Y72_22100 [Acidobacteriota bacterium]|nr:hypothetical protein [Acidobacteriota bacterium]